MPKDEWAAGKRRDAARKARWAHAVSKDYVIPAGTTVTVVSPRGLTKPHRTRLELTFAAPLKRVRNGYHFRHLGWLIKVAEKQVVVREVP